MTAKPKPKSKPANAKRNNKKNKSFKTKTDDFTRSPEYWEAYDNAKAELSRENEVKKLDRQLGQHTVIDNGGNGKADQNQNQKKLPVFSTYKYSKPVLHEAVIIDGLPFFLKYDAANDKLLTVEKIEESSRILRPPGREEYQYTPYEFANAEQLQQYIEVTKKETKDLLYQKAKYLVKKYNDQDDYKLNLLAIDIIWSYFQDKFATTHYLGITGENEGGKSSVGNTFEGTGYRVLNMTSPTAANVFRTLGIIEAGQCTLVLDESERISDDPDIMAILRSGYDFSKKIPKTNTNSWKQE